MDTGRGAGMRLKPYTDAGLRRLRCVRCDKPATEQWEVRSCRAGVNWGYLPLCDQCDAKLNRKVLAFFDRMPRRVG